jgi:hypothetical protein
VLVQQWNKVLKIGLLKGKRSFCTWYKRGVAVLGANLIPKCELNLEDVHSK